jgi:ribokinase
MGAPPLVCLGNLTVDDVVLPNGTERPGCTGGDAFYAALAARLAGVAAEMVAPQGHDLPAAIRDAIEAAGLSTEGLPEKPRPTLHNRVVYDAAGGRVWTLYASGDDFEVLSPRWPDVPPAWRAAPAFLILAMTLAAQEDLVAAIRRETGAFVALDPQEDYIRGNEERLTALIAAVDLYMPSEEEVRRHLGHEDWERAARHYAALGPRLVVIKRGADGVLVHDAATGTTLAFPAHPADPVDTTGAGDSFCGAFVASLIRAPGDVAAAARAGAAAASFTIAGYGVDALLAADARSFAARRGG